MNAIQIKNAVFAALAAVGGFIADRLGGWDALLQVLIALMAADYLTGLIVAGIFKKSPHTRSGTLSSAAGYLGLIKKCAALLLIYIGVLLDRALGEAFVRSALIIFFIGNEGLSLLENVGLMGVKYPKFLAKMLEALRDKGDKGDDK